MYCTAQQLKMKSLKDIKATINAGQDKRKQDLSLQEIIPDEKTLCY